MIKILFNALIQKGIESLSEYNVQALSPHGSHKQFFRLQKNSQSWMAVKVPVLGPASDEIFEGDDTKSQADYFIDIGEYLATHLPCSPIFYAQDKQSGWVLMSDEGSLCLDTMVASQRLSYYQASVDWLVHLQKMTYDNIPFFLKRSFSTWVMMAELQEFIEFVLKPANFVVSIEIEQLFKKIVNRLEKQPQTLIHRDFQSKNILVNQNSISVIDTQDMCIGSYSYDIASLLYDPYVDLSADEQAQLLHSFLSHVKGGQQEDIQWAGIQRLFKAAGRYARLRQQGNDCLWKYFQPAMKKIIQLLTELNEIETIKNLDFLLLRA